MKRLPFALIALSLSIPVVACLNSASEESSSSGEDNLSQETKDACNFAFAEVPNALVNNPAAPTDPSLLTMTTARGQTSGQTLLWGDFDGDGNKDFAEVKGAEEIQVYKGDGKGAFVKSKSAKKLPNIAGRKRSAIAIVAAGDFNGDGKSDIAALATSTDSAAADDAAKAASTASHLTILYGATTDNSLEAPKAVPSLDAPIAEQTFYQVAGDLDGDGKDDLVLTTAKGEIVALGGGADGKLTAIPSGFTSDHVRSLAFITPKAADDKPATLTIATPTEIATITIDKTPEHKATVATIPYAFPKGDLWFGADLDQNKESEIAILNEKGLNVIPVTPTQAKGANTFEGVPGSLIGPANFDGNNETELLYKVDEAKLFAACGAGANAGQIVASPIAVPYSKDVIVAGQLDVNKDGKADLITVDITTGPTRGTVKVYLSSGKQTPAPELTTFSTAGGTTTADAGVDSTTTTTETDASTGADSSTTTTETDASTGTADSGTTHPTTDAGTTHPTTDAGTHPTPHDAGTAHPQSGDDDDDDGETTPGDGEGTGTKNDSPKKPSTKPTNGASTGSATVTIIPKPQATDDGCSTAPGSHGVSSSAVGGLFAAMMLLVRRRRNRKNAA